MAQTKKRSKKKRAAYGSRKELSVSRFEEHTRRINAAFERVSLVEVKLARQEPERREQEQRLDDFYVQLGDVKARLDKLEVIRGEEAKILHSRIDDLQSNASPGTLSGAVPLAQVKEVLRVAFSKAPDWNGINKLYRDIAEGLDKL